MKPILFNTEMVRAILEGRKTTTRRVVKLQNGYELMGTPNEITENIALFGNDKLFYNGEETNQTINPPYKIGDILYVRETWCDTTKDLKDETDLEVGQCRYIFKVDDNGRRSPLVEIDIKRWRPSIHMPKEASRIFLKVTDIRVEKLQDITEEGAKAEGATKQIWYQPYGTRLEGNQKYVGDITQHEPNYVTGFAGIWDKTLGKIGDWLYSFRENPYVWVIEFERISKEEAFRNE